MKYCAQNDLSLFEFHDSQFSLISFDGKDLVISADHLNIHKYIPQNPFEYDMEIASAQITFKNFRSATYEPGRFWKTGADGKSYPSGPRMVYSGQVAVDRILTELKAELWVYLFVREENGRYAIDGCGTEPYFTVEFDCDGVTVCWDEYIKKAWYERNRQ